MQGDLPTKSVHISVLNNCVDCALCVLACPVDCFGFDQKGKRLLVINEPHCIVCLNCEDVSPVDAVRIGLNNYLPNSRPV